MRGCSLPGLLLLCLGLSAKLLAGPTDKVQRLWSLAPLARPEVPSVKSSGWVRTPIDVFILARLEEQSLAPSPEAGKTDLLRRATLDLVGLLPEPCEVDAFLADDSPEAFERAVERLLSSPHHGERWARHWLDLARYAESEGFKSDETRPNAWRYRDYVVGSFNEDKPYDRFVREQIAGDEIWPSDPEARVATAFNRHYPDESNARNLMQRRQEILNDITDTVGQVFTGLTFGCARCHDHKYDPISQADYYRLQAFFANVRAVDDLPLVSAGELRRHREKLAVWEEKTSAIRAEMAAIEEPKRKAIAQDNFVKFPPEVQSAISKPAVERTPIEWQMYYKAWPYMNPNPASIVGSFDADAKKRWQALKEELGKFSSLHPGDLPSGTGIADAGREAPRTFVLTGGVHDAYGREVEPGFLAAVGGGPPRIEPPNAIESTGRRTALAGWLTDPANPLTARVMANRVWHYHFGRGIAATPNDVGAMGERPTHPELLDWLAVELIEHGWSLKHLHRVIMKSSVYRQATTLREDASNADPDNKLFWRFPRSRLEGEVIRDAALQAAGLLNPKAGGPSVFPELPKGMGPGGYTSWGKTGEAAERNRRSIYVFVKRNLRYPLFEAFDMPDTHESCARRNVTTTAPQALMMLNDKLVLEWARAFAARVHESAGPDPKRQVEEAYRIAYSRRPDAGEVEMALAFLSRQGEIAGGTEPALADLCHVILNSNELVYRN